MKKLLPLFLMLLIKVCISQTTFEKTYGTSAHNEYGFDVVQLADTSYLMLGLSAPDSMRILKFSSTGNLIWNHGVDRVPQSFLYKISENNFFVTESGGIRKIDSLGNSQWYRSYIANDLNARLNPTHDSGYVCTGNISNPMFNYHAFGILKYDSSTALLQADTIFTDTIFKYWMLGIKELSDNNFIAAASVDSDTIAMGYSFFKIDTAGNILWKKNISRDSIIIKEMIALADGGFIISGTRPLNSFRLFVKRFDANGNLIGNNSYINTYEVNNRLQIQQTSDKGFIIGGEIGTSGTDLLILKTDSLGNQEWYRTFGSSTYDSFGSVRETFDHGYIICGAKYVLGNNNDYYLIKTDSMGIVDSLFTNNSQLPNSVSEIKIYPNPARQMIHITAQNFKRGKAEMKIFDLLGKLLLLKEENIFIDGYLSSKISIEDLSKGIYFINVNDGNKNVVMKLIIE